MASDNRPLSPHIQVYRWQWTMLLSIAHRATGVVLSVGTLLLVWWLAAAAAGPESYDAFRGFIGSFFGQLLLIGWVFCLYYHLLNGIRHLVWDSVNWLELDSAYTSGVVVVSCAIGLTVLSFIVGWIVW